ncbi:Hypothetical predicted protein [Podarcis lilfordi]|uniref:Uncharacterized protein n=1 Tax=Podarcis lilfordi TaxID=74358 RepID=A0AA35NY29_9SAUR|nr:Hypothetical predicted protein [Podarcis lilfordi]
MICVHQKTCHIHTHKLGHKKCVPLNLAKIDMFEPNMVRRLPGQPPCSKNVTCIFHSGCTKDLQLCYKTRPVSAEWYICNLCSVTKPIQVSRQALLGQVKGPSSSSPYSQPGAYGKPQVGLEYNSTLTTCAS